MPQGDYLNHRILGIGLKCTSDQALEAFAQPYSKEDCLDEGGRQTSIRAPFQVSLPMVSAATRSRALPKGDMQVNDSETHQWSNR